MLFQGLVSASRSVARTPSRTAKVDRLAGFLASLDPSEIPVAVGLLIGRPRQGRVGVGYAAFVESEVPGASFSTLTLADVDHVLSALGRESGTGSTDRRAELLRWLFSRATDDEASFLKRVLVGEVRQGAGAALMIEAIARASDTPASLVRRATMLSGDPGETASLALGGGAPALQDVGLMLFRPIAPMLASTARSIVEAVGSIGRPVVEAKLDGARIQLHRAGEEIRVFTRNLIEATERLPEVVDAARSLAVDSVVLDGEAIALSGEGMPLRFDQTISSFSSEGGSDSRTAHGVTPVFFDVLHLDGRDLIDLPLEERMALLDSAVPEEWRVDRIVTGDPSEAEEFFAAVVGSGQEGVVIKDPTRPYAAGRRGKAWRKVKPVHTLDLVVLAAEWGHGRRTGWLSNLHLGARDPVTGGFVMLGKTFKGLTDEMLQWQTDRFQDLAERRTKNVVHVRPEQVVEVAFDGVLPSPRYPGGVSLRFARVVRYRDDKGPETADTIDTVKSLLRI